MERRPNFPPQRPAAPQPPTDQQLRSIIVEGDPEATVQVADEVGAALANLQLTTSQIRSFFGAVREIEMSWPDPRPGAEEEDRLRQGREARRKFVLLKPRLAYYVGKEKDYQRQNAMKYLERVLSRSIDIAKDNREHFGNFVDFFEAILAYHKMRGGRD